MVELASPFDPLKVADPEPLRLVGAVTVPMGKPTGWSVLMLTDVIATLELMLHVKETSFLVLPLPRVPVSDTLATIGTGGLAAIAGAAANTLIAGTDHAAVKTVRRPRPERSFDSGVAMGLSSMGVPLDEDMCATRLSTLMRVNPIVP